MIKLDEKTKAALRTSQAQALERRRGLIGPKDDAYIAAPLKRWGEYIEAKSPVTREVDVDKKAMIARYLDHQFSFLHQEAAAGNFLDRFKMDPHTAMAISGGRLDETTTSGDIAAYTTQILAFVLPVFERIVVDQLVHFRAMQGPTAFVHTLDFQVGTAGGAYAVGTSFQGNLDVNYADCPTECNDANEVDLVLTSTTITAICKRLQAKWCLPAQQDYMSQHGRSIGDDVRGMIQLEIAREKQGEILNELVTGAGYSGTWSSTIPGGSVYNTLDPKAYDATLYDAIEDANNEIFKSAGGYRGANWIAGDPDSINRLEKLKRFAITMVDRVPRDQAGTGTVDEFGNFFGVANHTYNVWKLPFMAENTILLGVKSDAPQELGYIHAEYIPLYDLGTWLDPSSGQYRTGMQSRYANTMIRSDLYAKVTIT